MKTTVQRRFGFCQGQTYPAIVKKVKKDRVFFTLTNSSQEQYEAVYYIHGEGFNPFHFFKNETEIEISLLRFHADRRLYCGVSIEVKPLHLPLDAYILKHPIGSIVTGIVEKIKGDKVILRLDQFTTAIVKRFKEAKIGESILCTIERVNEKKHCIFVRVN